MNRIIIVVLLIFLPILLFGQERYDDHIQVVYKVEVNREGLPSMSSLSARERTMINGVLKSVDEIRFSLVANDSSYSFQPLKTMDSDYSRDLMPAIVRVGGNYIFHKNSKRKLKQVNFIGENFNVILPLNEFEWEISEEKKEISGYSCLRARSSYVTKNSRGNSIVIPVVAWFSPDLNISAGPLGLDGLPGLVLQASIDKKFTYKAEVIDLNFQGEVPLPGEAQVVTKEEYDAMIIKKVKEFSSSH